MNHLYKKHELFGVNFDAITMDELVALTHQHILNNERKILAFSNPEFIVESEKNSFLKNYLNRCDYNLADGTGIVLASKFLGKDLPERITGTDWVYRFCELAANNNLSVFFLGGRPGLPEGLFGQS